MKMIGPRCRKTRVQHAAVTTRNYRARAPPTREPQFNNVNTDLLTYIQCEPNEIYLSGVNKVLFYEWTSFSIVFGGTVRFRRVLKSVFGRLLNRERNIKFILEISI